MISNRTLISKLQTSFALLFGLAIISTSGCFGGLGVGATAMPTEPVSTSSKGMYQVEMSRNFGKSTAFKGEIDGELTVQDALDRSGAIEKYRHMEVDVYRVVEDSGRGLKMPVIYKSGSKSVLPEQNYALHPNDRIVVSPRTNTAIDKMIDSLNPYN